MLGRIEGLTKPEINGLGIEKCLADVRVVEGATGDRHDELPTTDFLESPPRGTVVVASVYAAASELRIEK